MKERKHIFNKGGGSFQFSCVVRTTKTIPQMISSTSKEFTFRSGNVPLLCRYTGFSPPKRGIVCLVSLFIFSSVPITIVLNSLSRRLITMHRLVINMVSFERNVWMIFRERQLMKELNLNTIGQTIQTVLGA